jgi:hypothetical protein
MIYESLVRDRKMILKRYFSYLDLNLALITLPFTLIIV